MANFSVALKALESGKAVRRTDWGFSPISQLELLEYHGEKVLYIRAPFNTSPPTYIKSYCLRYEDLKSTEWEIIV
jgi:hypothetical protein